MFSIMSVSVMGASVDLTMNKEVVCDDELVFGLTIDNLRYEVTYDDSMIKSIIQKDDVVESAFEIETTGLLVREFIAKYSTLGIMERIGFLANKFGVPVKYLFNMNGLVNYG